MIIIKLFGGLGNQMFQYALGRCLSVKYKKHLYLDISWFERKGKDENRFYGLDSFNIEAKTFNNNLLNILAKIASKVALVFPFLNNYFVFEKNFFIFNKSILNHKNGYFKGFWQNEKYFLDIRNYLIDDFTLNQELSMDAKDINKKIEQSDSVSIHIRRGDFLNIDLHGICSSEYYRKATELMENKITTPTYFIFSDDIDWVKANLSFKFPMIFVSDNQLTDREEMILMSRCKHNIIANSSFSWWGAWLNCNKTKVVIAPKKWLDTDTLDFSDIIPSTWIKI